MTRLRQGFGGQGGEADISRPLAEVLGELVRLAEQLMAKPYLIIAKRDALDALEREVEGWIAMPVEDVRLVDERAAWLIKALRKIGAAGNDAERAPWRDLAIILTEHAMAALAAALAVRPSP